MIFFPENLHATSKPYSCTQTGIGMSRVGLAGIIGMMNCPFPQAGMEKSTLFPKITDVYKKKKAGIHFGKRGIPPECLGKGTRQIDGGSTFIRIFPRCC